ncbi:P-II family nitrogen regulator [Kamptonema formosum]|uniref:P-II family nitrogen regulator n=1 Tax=Kamptonema formosum TaxID=331992 RepID=UPI0003748654|nr:P-II family nitrogen regulator [Oscillatoria sp. PCC 10802]
MKKVEIIITSLELEKVLSTLEEVGVSGYTIIREVTGKGERGVVSNDLEMGAAFSNGYVMSICTEEKATEFVEIIRPLLKKFGGVCLLSDVQSIIH